MSGITPSDGDFNRARIWADGRKAAPLGRVGRSWVKVAVGPDGEIAHTRVGEWLSKRFVAERKQLFCIAYTSTRGERVRGVETANGLEITVNGVVVWKSRKKRTTA